MNVHVWGASGYAAAEVIRLLHAHPLVDVGVLESRSHTGERLADHFPLLRTVPYRFDGPNTVLSAIVPGDVVIAAGAHGEARAHIPAFVSAGARVVDLSSDYRCDDEAAYGLTEWNREAISSADIVANPGCYPTATLLALLPLVRAMRPLQLIVDAKSGITGAGRKPVVGSLFAEVSGDVRAYGLEGHRHQPEIERVLSFHDGLAPFVFTPHVVPLSRGMLVDAYAVYASPIDPHDIASLFARAYADEPFVRILDAAQTPSLPAVVGTNATELRVDVAGPTVRMICAIDNLGKGAAGQAIQNLNVMLGYPEEIGLDARTVVA